jgi:hypothetical protein
MTPIGIKLGEILSDLALPIGVVEGVVDHLGRDAEARGLVAVDRDFDPRRIRQKIGRDIDELPQRLQLFQQFLRPLDQLGNIGVLQGVLEARARGASSHGDVLRCLEKQGGALDLGDLRSQSVDDLGGRGSALIARLQCDVEARRVRGLGIAGYTHAAGIGGVSRDIGIAE